jgi:hypothetical protein
MQFVAIDGDRISGDNELDIVESMRVRAFGYEAANATLAGYVE